MKSIFFGTPDFALPSLESTYKNSELLAVVCQPDRPRGRGQKLSPCPVKEAALKYGVKIFSPSSLRKDSEELEALRAHLRQNSVDLFVVTAYGNLLTDEFLKAPRLGAVNVHASLLPRWRGAAPIQRALEAGDLQSGVSLQKMVMELDAGDVIDEQKILIEPNCSAPELSQKLAKMGGEVLDKFFKRESRAGELSGKAQNSAQVTLAPKLKKEEGEWKGSWTATQSHNRIRAFAAWPGVRAKLKNGEEIKILESELATSALNLEAGQIGLGENRVFLGRVRAGENGLVIKKIQIPGKGPIAAFDYFQNLAKKKPEDMQFI